MLGPGWGKGLGLGLGRGLGQGLGLRGRQRTEEWRVAGQTKLSSSPPPPSSTLSSRCGRKYSPIRNHVTRIRIDHASWPAAHKVLA